MMPPYPSYLPKEEDIKHMVSVARRNPMGWHSIKAYRRGTGRSAEKTQSGPGSGLPASTEEAILDHFAIPKDSQVLSVDTHDELRESRDYRVVLPSSTTLYTQPESHEGTPRTNSKDK